MISIEKTKNTTSFPVSYETGGISDSARLMQASADFFIQESLRNVSFGEQVADILEKLLILRDLHSEPDWDGCGAEPLNIRSYINAQRFVLSLPGGVPLPEVYVIPTGEVLFEWSLSNYNIFSVIINADNKLSYATLFGVDKSYGTAELEDRLPEYIIQNIYQVYSSN